MTRADRLRDPPVSIEAEQAVLGGLLLRGDAMNEIADWIAENDFYRRDHRMIYRAMRELAVAGKPFDAVTLGEWFHAQNLAELIGGASYVIELANTTPSAANIAAYAEIVREKSTLRKLIDIGTELAGNAFDPKARSAELIGAEAVSALSQLGGGARPVGPASAKVIGGAWFADMQRRYDEREDISGVLTPWRAMNELTNGLQSGDLILIAGRPSMGKSILGEQLSTFNALRGNRTDVYSLEMRAQQWLQRGVSSLSGISHRHLQKPSLITDPEWAAIMDAHGRVSAAPLFIDDQPQLSAQQIVARAERQHMRQKTTLIVIDHLHEIRRPGRDQITELGDAASLLRALGKKLHVPIVLLAQLNRGASNRTDHRPTMTDLRGSGAVEEKADVIFLLHREDYYDKTSHMKGVIEVIVEKGRDLPRGETIHLANRFDIMRANDWEGALPIPATKEDKKPKKTLAAAYQERRA